MTTPEPIRKSLLPCVPPPEWEFHTWFPVPDGGGDMMPGQFQRGIGLRRRVTYGDWEPVTPDHWAEEEPTSAVPAPGLMQCPTCGPTPTEPHPRRAGVDRCANCKEHAPVADAADDQCVRLADFTAGIGYPVRCPHCDAGPIPPTHWTKHLQRHHPNAPAVCSGADGFCPAHGFHRHAPAPDGLRDRYAAALEAADYRPDMRRGDLADAVLAVRDEELQRLRTEAATADQIRADVQRERDRLREELTRFKVAADKAFCPGCMLREDQRESMQHVARETGLKLTETKRAAMNWMDRATEAEATVERVRAECDRIEAAVRANPHGPDFDGAYLAALGHIRNALSPQEKP